MLYLCAEVIFLKIAILAIGNEVLCGKVVDTNSAVISREIEKLGAKVVHHEVVLDNIDDIVRGLRNAYEYANFVITIGGLGPTVDDLTREGVAHYFNEELIYDEYLYALIEQHFSRMKRQMPKNNVKQAYRFAKGQVLENNNGTAPGLRLDQENKKIFLLPGPPNEMLPLFENDVKPVINQLIDEPNITRSYRLYGIGESPAEEKILHLYHKYPMLEIAPYCTISFIDYVATAKASAVQKLDEFEKDFLEILKRYCIGAATAEINQQVVAELKKQKMTVAVAESCTGGMLASAIIDVPGASIVFQEGFVTYSNESKIKRLKVKPATIATYGAVSAECVEEMVQGLQEATGADIAIAITGIAGPEGGSADKPVGTTFIGISIKNKNYIYPCNFSGNREKIRIRCRDQALFLLNQLLNNRTHM